MAGDGVDGGGYSSDDDGGGDGVDGGGYSNGDGDGVGGWCRWWWLQ